MEKQQAVMGSHQSGQAHSESLGQSTLSVCLGMYHLVHDQGWREVFVSEDCLALLGCTRESFLETLQRSLVFLGESGAETQVGQILQGLALAPGREFYTGAARHGGGKLRWIKSTLTSFPGGDGKMQLYGQVADITDQYEHDRAQALDRAGLLQAAHMAFPEILSMNLTRETYRIIQYDGATTLGTPQEGKIEDMLLRRLDHVHPEDQEEFKRQFFPQGQRLAFREGKGRIQLAYRRRGGDGVWHWMESIVASQENPYDDDLLTFAVSRSLDEEKGKELHLRDQLRQQSEELTLTMGQMGKHISYYQVNTRTLTTLPETAREFGVPIVSENFPESFLADPPKGYPPESGELLRAFMAAIHRGEAKGSCEYPTVTAAGRKVWLHREFATIFDDLGQPVRAVISSQDVTERYDQDQRQELDRAGLLRVAQLVFPEILSINLTKGTCRVVQSVLETPQGLSLDEFLTTRLSDIAPEDQEPFRSQFFRENQLQAIEEGKGRFQLTYRRRNDLGVWHWIETTVVRLDNHYNEDILTYAVSRNVDQQKAQEELLRQALADSTEKLEGWLYYNSLSSRSFPGLVYVNYLDERPSPYSVGTLAKRLDCPVKELALSTCFRIPLEDRGLLHQAYEKARETQEPSFHAEYRVETDRGEMAWVSNTAVFFQDKEGGAGYIHFLVETTQEHALMEQVHRHMEEKLQENEKIFSIVAQHSDRTLCYYDVVTRKARPWSEEACETCELTHMCMKKFSLEQFEQGDHILPDSREDALRMVREIHDGVPFGEANVRVRMPDGSRRWLEYKYSDLFEDGVPTAALISYKDVTERHEQEMAHRWFVRSMGEDAEHLGYLEADLDTDYIEKHTGMNYLGNASFTGKSYTAYWQTSCMSLAKEEQESAKALYARETLMEACRQGLQKLDNIWRIEREGVQLWVRIVVELMKDSFSGHIRMFGNMADVTLEQEARIAVNTRADYDAMTGLLRRGVGEERIRTHLAAEGHKAGILVILDLDDLKGINDTLGHQQGDAAILGIANTLKEHFRKDDILVRAGGDEFIVFLPNAGESSDAIEMAMVTLLRKLSGIFIGENNERTIHCSVGCAVERPGEDTYEDLFQRADKALYHVKRSGKNNFAFYEPEMAQADYAFRAKQLLSAQNAKKFDHEEVQRFLSTLVTFYQLVLSVNLTNNTYFMMEEVRDGVFAKVPDYGALDDFVALAARAVHPEDAPGYLATLSRESLLQTYGAGAESVRHYFRFYSEGSWRWIECLVIFYVSDQGDVCDFTMLRWADERAREEAPEN